MAATTGRQTIGLAQMWESTAGITVDQLEYLDRLNQIITESGAVAEVDQQQKQKKSVGTLSTFYHWYGAMLSDMEDDKHVAALSSYQTLTADLAKQTSLCVESLERLLSSHGTVREKTSALDDACNQMLKEQERLIQLSDDVKQMLSFFDEHDVIFKQLGDPDFTPENCEFGSLLRRLDECIEYMSEHTVFKDARLYIVRFKQLQSKALAIVRDHCIQLLRATGTATANDPGGSLTITASQARFRAIAPQLKRVVGFLQKRAGRREISVLYGDVQSEYHAQRQKLLYNSIIQTVGSLTPPPIDKEDGITPLLRRVCSQFITTCQMEYQLYHEIFPSAANKGLERSLQAMFDPLYTQFRTCVVHLVSINVLCDVILLLHGDILNGEVERRGESVASLSPIIEKMMEDAEERLIYRTETHVRDVIRGYDDIGDLDYPSILYNGDETSKIGKDLTDSSSWYPPVQNTLVLMAKLYHAVDEEVFESLAQELLLICTSSLISASARLSKKSDTLHATLFLVRHLLIVRDQISAFDVDFTAVEKMLDFSGVRTALSLFDFSHALTLSSRNAFVGLVYSGVPSVKQSVVDAKKTLEKELKDSCEDLILLVVRAGIKDLLEFLVKAQAFLSEEGDVQQRERPLHTQSWADPSTVEKLLKTTTAELASKLSPSVELVRLYITVDDTVKLLLQPVKHHILEAFSRVQGILASNYAEGEVDIGTVSSEELDVMVESALQIK